MPSSRKPGNRGDGPLLSTWRQEGPSGGRAKLWLIVRRTIAMLLALMLVGWLAYLIFSPLLLPKTFFAFICADEVRTLSAPPIEFVFEDFAGFAKLQDAMTPSTEQGKRLVYMRLASGALLEGELEALEESSIGADDAVILYIAAHGLVRDDKAYLICNHFDPASGGEKFYSGLYEVTELLKRIGRLPGATKLVLLDADRSQFAPSLGMTINQFPQVLKQEVDALNLPSVWVLSANSPGERSHVSPALERSVFGYMAATGLQGAADLNEDGKLHLPEFYQFVRSNVSAWVRQATGDSESQTPVLLGRDAARVATEDPHLLFVSNLPKIETVSASINAAQTNQNQASALDTTIAFMSNRLAEFGVRPLSAAFEAVTKPLSGSDAGEGTSTAEAPPDEPVPPTARAVRIEGELKLLKQAWQQTFQVAGQTPAPVAYAPHLWRLHLDRLLWLEGLQQSGERDGVVQREWAEAVQRINRSLEQFDQPYAPSPDKPATAVDLVRQRRPVAPFTADEAPSLALAQEATTAPQPNAVNPQEITAALNQWLASAEPVTAWETLAAKNWGDRWRQFYELQLWDELTSHTELSPETIKLALETRLLGERITADPLWGQGWAAVAVQQADGLRLEAERLLRDNAASDWRTRSGQNLRRARRLYQDAQAELAEVEAAIRLHREGLGRARDYLQWRRHAVDDASSLAPSTQRLTDLFVTLNKLQSALDSPGPAGMQDLRAYHGRLERILEDLQAGLSARAISELTTAPFKPGDAARIDALLRTALLGADERAKCLAARLAAEQELMRGYDWVEGSPRTVNVSPPRADQRNAADYLRLEELYLQTFAPSGSGSSATRGSSDAANLTELASDSRALGEKLLALPAEILRLVRENSNLASVEKRPARLLNLHRSTAALFLIRVSDAILRENSSGDAVVDGDVLQLIHSARWYDLLTALRARQRHAQLDAPPAELALLRQQANRLGELAVRIPGQPPLTEHGPPRLSLTSAQTTVELVTDDLAKVNLTVASQMDTPVWIVAQYDERLIDLAGVDTRVIAEHQLPPVASTATSWVETGYPYRPAARGVPETLLLTAGQPRRLDLEVRRLGAAGGNAVLVLKAIDRDESIRHQVPIRLPGRQELQLEVADARRVTRSIDDNIRLFPNRAQDLSLTVANKSGEAKTLVGALYAPQRAAAQEIPRGALEVAAAEQILRRFGRRDLIATTAEFELTPGGSRPLRFEFEPPVARANDGQKPADGPPMSRLPHGILLELVDQKSQQRTLWWLRFEVWKPLSYLKAVAEYIPADQELRVTMQGADSERLPVGSVTAQLEIDPAYLSPLRERRTSVSMDGPGDRGVLTVPLSGEWPRDGFLPAVVHVDNYPRAFSFRVPRATRPITLQPQKEATQIRIVSPLEGTEFAARRTVAVRVEADTPEGFFDEPDAEVEIGIDVDQDRLLEREEETFVLRSDRQVDIDAGPPQGEGSMTLQPYVRDLELELPTEGISGRKVNVLAEVKSPGPRQTEREYHYVEIVLDGQGPVLNRRQLYQTGSVLTAELYLDDLTSVASVSARFDVAEAKWEEAKLQAGGRWVAELKTDKLPPDTYTVLFKATDTVGNESTFAPEYGVVIEAADAAPAEQTDDSQKPVPVPVVKNRVAGRAIYGATSSVSKLTAKLTGGAGQPRSVQGQGERFDFGQVPAGTYQLEVRALASNKFRRATQSVTVSDQPDRPTLLEIKLP
jgi:hypothetical protein